MAKRHYRIVFHSGEIASPGAFSNAEIEIENGTGDSWIATDADAFKALICLVSDLQDEVSDLKSRLDAVENKL